MYPFIRPALGVAALAALIFTLQPRSVPAAPRSPEKGPPDDQAARLPPPPLSTSTRAKALVRALKRIGEPPTLATMPQELEMRLTPMASQLANGTRITKAIGVTFVGGTGDVPGGYYIMWPFDRLTEIHLRVHTEKDKLYVADCRLVEQSWSNDKPVDIDGSKVFLNTAGVDNQELPVVDGHGLFVFRGQSVGTTLKLRYEARPFAAWLLFYGCDFGQVG
jgi:hypothetical protein